MKRIFRGILSLTAACAVPGCAPSPPITGPADRASAPAATLRRAEAPPGAIVTKGPKKRVAVIKFQDKSPYGRGRLGGAVQDILITELSKSGLFILVSRGADMDLILDEQDLAKSGTIKTGTGAKSGEVLGLNAIITGAISQFGVKQKSATYLVGASKTRGNRPRHEVVLGAQAGKGERRDHRDRLLRGRRGGVPAGSRRGDRRQ